MRAVLFSTYELGRQPFGLASAAAWLRRAGADVDAHDLAQCGFDPSMVDGADLVGVYLPMHTATRLAEPLVRRVKEVVPGVHVAAFGLYAPMNDERLRSVGVDSILGAEFERALVDVHDRLAGKAPAGDRPGERLRLVVPDRSGLPSPDRYAGVRLPDGTIRIAGSTEATRGCKHTCRHCPIVPVYGGRFVVVDPEVVLADVRAQVAAGAAHVTFGDPDFFNGPVHAIRVVRALHAEFPDLTYDVTIKVEHLVDHARLLPELVETGCILVTTAVESFDPEILERFDKGHDPAQFEAVLDEMRRIGLAINPTFVAFTPWTTRAGYLDFLARIARLGLVGNVSPIQYAIRLLVPAGSLLLELPEVASLVGEFDAAALVHPWAHPDPGMDELQRLVMAVVEGAGDDDRAGVFAEVWKAARAMVGDGPWPIDPPLDEAVPRATVPYLTEPWYC